MISKERLEELIEQGATIFQWQFVNLKEIKLNKSHRINIFMGEETLFKPYCEFDEHIEYDPVDYIKCLFETKEEAEWFAEFGNIERTERLELPTWEEIQKYERFDFKDKYNHSYTLHYISGFKNLAISGWSTEYYAPATKENYILACRKAKELFLGE